jgi:hypothetical protein
MAKVMRWRPPLTEVQRRGSRKTASIPDRASEPLVKTRRDPGTVQAMTKDAMGATCLATDATASRFNLSHADRARQFWR